MSYKFKEQICKRFGSNLPSEIAYSLATQVDAETALDLEESIEQAYNAGKRTYVLPKKFVTDSMADTFSIVINLKDEWFEEEHELFVPTEYQWYKINFACACEIADDDTILVRNWLGKIEIAKNKDELLNCNKAVIAEFMVINSDVPF